MRSIYVILLVVLCTVANKLNAQSITYITIAGAGSNDGSSWSNAKAGTQLRAVLRVATEHDQVWIGEGTYYPHPTSRDSSFFVGKNVKIYGGFAGTETSVAGRDWATNRTILSGDIGIENDITDNSRHVMYLSNTYDSTIIDGVTITNGNANGEYDEQPINGMGGGVVNHCSNYPELDATSNPKFYNCTFLKNYAFKGGGAYTEFNGGVNNSSFYNCTFDGNSSKNQGGVYYAEMMLFPTVSPTFDHCRFVNNIMDTSSVPLNSQGGVFFLAKYDTSASNYITEVRIRNCYFERNAAREGGVIASGQGYRVTIDSCIFRNNYARSAAVIYGGNSDYNISNCQVDSNSARNIIIFATSLNNGQVALHTKRYLSNTTFAGNSGFYTVVNQTETYKVGQYPSDSTYITNCLFFNNGQYGVIRAQAYPDGTTNTFLNNITVYDDEDFVFQKAFDRQVLNLANDQSGIFGPGKSSMFINNSIIWYPIRLIGDRSIKSRREGTGGGTAGIVSTEVKNTIFRSGSGTWPSESGTDGGGNLINEDPFFVDTLGNFRLNCSSPALNSGLNSLYPASAPATDVDGAGRFYSTTIDRGPYEQQAVMLAIEPVILVDGYTITINIGANYTIESASWTLGDGTTGTGTYIAHTYAGNGTYTVCLSITTSCGEKDTCFTLSIPGTSGIENNVAISDFAKIYPNPAQDICWIETDHKNLPYTVLVREMTGRVLQEVVVNTVKTPVAISALRPGIYLLTMTKNGRITKGYKLLKQ